MINHRDLTYWVAAGLLALLLTPPVARAGYEPKFDVLQIGTQTLTNATVTSTNSRFIFVSHAGGLESVRVADLSPETREKLGYVTPKPKTNTVANWTKAQVARINTQELENVRDDLQARLPIALPKGIPLNPVVVGSALVGLFFGYVLFCCCCTLVCRKAGVEAGVMAWLPILQVFPLVRAAGMSPIWALGMLVPALNVLVYIAWCLRIAQARGKSPFVGVLMILPVTNFLAFLYLALSGGKKADEAPKRSPQLMTLETA